MTNDPVNSPVHYIGATWECIDIIEALGLDFHRGNALKYIARHKLKGGDQDIAKALWYLQRALAKITVTASMSFGMAWDHTAASAMTGDAIAANFGIDDERLATAIRAIRESAFEALPRVDIEQYLGSAALALRGYLTMSQAAQP